MHFQLQPRSKKQRTKSETVTAQDPGKSHPSHSAPTDIKKTHTGHGQDTNTSDHDEVWNHLQPFNDFPDSCFEIIDLTRAVPNVSPQTEPEHIYHFTFEEVPGVDEADTVVWDPEEDLGRADGDETVMITLDYVNSEDVTQSAEMNGVTMQAFQLPLPSANDLPTLAVQSIHGEAVQTAQDSGLNLLPQDLPSPSSSLLSPSTSPDYPGNPESTRRASICRIKVVEDLLGVFMDSSIINLTLQMDFVNEKSY
uniref:uncharacterized protein LOC117270188 n=1 Tax=Epinephelus lanceolatus TaxID=310571 RepID=UPI00144648F7|nr:uncharacterized protein LOC117270188 [Epinephelus lanceolatus]